MIWVTGASGMLGYEVQTHLKRNHLPFVCTGREIDISIREDVEHYCSSIDGGNGPEWIINCAAYTAVDDAEDDKETAALVNETGVQNLAEAAKETGANLIHISTDYVFGGGKRKAAVPYKENEAISPLGVYGSTKAAGERAVISTLSKYYIFRTAWLYGLYGKNFVYTMLRLMNSRNVIKVVDDQWGTPTFCGDLSNIIVETVKQNGKVPFGIYHVTDIGQTTWYDFANAIYAEGKTTGFITKECVIQPCATSDMILRAARPAWAVLDKSKILSVPGMKLPRWEESLKRFILTISNLSSCAPRLQYEQ